MERFHDTTLAERRMRRYGNRAASGRVRPGMRSSTLTLLTITVVAGLLTGCSAAGPASPAPSSAEPTPTATGTTDPATTGVPTAGGPGATDSPGATGGPASTAAPVVLTRTGGVAGRRDTVTVAPDGRWTASDRTGATRTGQLSAADLDRLRALTDPATRSGRSGPAPDGCADAFAYRITAGARTVGWSDCPNGPQPPPAADELAQLLLKLTAA